MEFLWITRFPKWDLEAIVLHCFTIRKGHVVFLLFAFLFGMKQIWEQSRSSGLHHDKKDCLIHYPFFSAINIHQFSARQGSQLIIYREEVDLKCLIHSFPAMYRCEEINGSSLVISKCFLGGRGGSHWHRQALPLKWHHLWCLDVWRKV